MWFSRQLTIFITLIFGFLSQSWALDLECAHLVPIQMRFLARHVNYTELNKNLEARTVERFIKTLDGSKIYFTEADVAEVKGKLNNIFEKTRKGDCKALNESQALLKKRIAENIAMAQVYLGKDFKFDPKTKITLDPKKRTYAKNKKEVEAFQKKYIQLQVANYIATDIKEDEARTKVLKNYERSLKRASEEKPYDVYVAYLDAFATALDPHSTYWSSDQYSEFEISIRLSLEGIGATLSSKDGFTVVEQLMPGGAAEASGLVKVKDKIVAVGQGDDGVFEDVIDLELRDVVKKIRGKKGTKVRLKLLRQGDKGMDNLVVTLVRDRINIEDEAASITYHDKEINNKKMKVGLINLPSFYAGDMTGQNSSAAHVKKLLRQAKDNKADAIVLDLSTNGGGSLQDAVDIAGLFFREGNVVKQSSRNPMNGDTLADKDPMVDYAGPLVVLISRMSASASEIVSGTLQDYKRAVIVGGDHSYGKGTVQAVDDRLPKGLGALKTTIGMYFIPGGRSTQHVGVKSDVELPSTMIVEEFGEKTQDYSLPPRQIKPFLSAEAFVESGPGFWGLIDKKMVTQLKATSQKRVAQSAEFKKIYADIEKNKKRAQKGEVVLGEFLKDRKDNEEEAEIKADEGKTYEQSKQARKERYLKRADIQEAMNVAADLAGLQAKDKLAGK